MTIEKSTGLIQWDVPPDFRGKASVTVSVTDNQGGEGLQSFIYDIAAESNRITALYSPLTVFPAPDQGWSFPR